MRVPALCPGHALALALPSTGRLPSTLSAPRLSAGVVRGFIGTMRPSDSSDLPIRLRLLAFPNRPGTALAAAGGRSRVAQGNCTPTTGSPGAVAHPRFPQNVACGFCFAAPSVSRTTLFDRWFTALSLLFVPGPFPWSASSSLCIEGCLSHCMEPMSPQNKSPAADRFPLWTALPSSEYYQSV